MYGAGRARPTCWLFQFPVGCLPYNPGWRWIYGTICLNLKLTNIFHLFTYNFYVTLAGRWEFESKEASCYSTCTARKENASCMFAGSHRFHKPATRPQCIAMPCSLCTFVKIKGPTLSFPLSFAIEHLYNFFSWTLQ